MGMGWMDRKYRADTSPGPPLVKDRRCLECNQLNPLYPHTLHLIHHCPLTKTSDTDMVTPWATTASKTHVDSLPPLIGGERPNECGAVFEKQLRATQAKEGQTWYFRKAFLTQIKRRTGQYSCPLQAYLVGPCRSWNIGRHFQALLP